MHVEGYQMNKPTTQFSPQTYARIGGVLYLIIIAAGLFARTCRGTVACPLVDCEGRERGEMGRKRAPGKWRRPTTGCRRRARFAGTRLDRSVRHGTPVLRGNEMTELLSEASPRLKSETRRPLPTALRRGISIET